MGNYIIGCLFHVSNNSRSDAYLGKNHTREPSPVFFICVFVGPFIKDSLLGHWLTLDLKTLSFILPAYAFFADAMPVWLLLAPRDYLNTFMKIGVFAVLSIHWGIHHQPNDSNASVY